MPESDTDLAVQGTVQIELARRRVDARMRRRAAPTDQEFERARDQLLGLVQMLVPGSAIQRQGYRWSSRAHVMGALGEAIL